MVIARVAASISVTIAMGVALPSIPQLAVVKCKSVADAKAGIKLIELASLVLTLALYGVKV